jgi:YD repeat-containing protein
LVVARLRQHGLLDLREVVQRLAEPSRPVWDDLMHDSADRLYLSFDGLGRLRYSFDGHGRLRYVERVRFLDREWRAPSGGCRSVTDADGRIEASRC